MLAMPSDEYPNRIRRARDLMRERGIDGLIVTDPVNYSYFTGHKVASSLRSRPAIFILPLDGAPVLIAWSGPDMFARLYKQPFPSWVEDRRIYPEVPFTRDARVDWGIADILKERGLEAGRLAVELGREVWLGIAVGDFDLLKESLPRALFVDSGPVIWGCRMIKSEWEIDCMRKACEIGGRAWQRVFEELKPGISVAAIQRRVLEYYYDGGATSSRSPRWCLAPQAPTVLFRRATFYTLTAARIIPATRWTMRAVPYLARPQVGSRRSITACGKFCMAL